MKPASVVERMARLGPMRPCDATDAHQEIGDAARRLGRQGRIAVDFAVTSRMSRRERPVLRDNGQSPGPRHSTSSTCSASALAAISCRVSRRPHPVPAARLGHGAEAVVSPLPQGADPPRRPAPLDRPAAKLELHVRRMPHDEPEEELQRGGERLPHDLVEIDVSCETCHGPEASTWNWRRSGVCSGSGTATTGTGCRT